MSVAWGHGWVKRSAALGRTVAGLSSEELSFQRLPGCAPQNRLEGASRCRLDKTKTVHRQTGSFPSGPANDPRHLNQGRACLILSFLLSGNRECLSIHLSHSLITLTTASSSSSRQTAASSAVSGQTASSLSFGDWGGG